MLRGDAKAIRDMVAYNKRDVELLEAIFEKLRPFVPNHVNRHLFGGEGQCPRCGSNHINVHKWRVTQTQRYRQLQCQDCGGYFADRKADKTLQTPVTVL